MQANAQGTREISLFVFLWNRFKQGSTKHEIPSKIIEFKVPYLVRSNIEKGRNQDFGVFTAG